MTEQQTQTEDRRDARDEDDAEGHMLRANVSETVEESPEDDVDGHAMSFNVSETVEEVENPEGGKGREQEHEEA